MSVPPQPPSANRTRYPPFTYPLQTIHNPTGPITCAIHTSYDPSSPPPLPGPSTEWTRFVCISDTHTNTFDVPDGDVLIHSGDLTGTGRKAQMKITGDWLIEMGHPVKIVIAGNHDLPFHESWYQVPTNQRRFHGQSHENPTEVRDILTNDRAKAAGIIYLEDELCKLRVKEGGREWSVYGSPWQPYFGNWAFNYRPGEEAEARVAHIPEVDILLTHGPPYKILDRTLGHEHVGCPSLLRHLGRMTIPPRLHVFGHIHEARGALVHQWDPDPNSMPVGNTNSESEWEWEVSSDSDSPGVSEEEEEARNPASPERDRRRGWKETIMVNAANQPAGNRRILNGRRVPFGGPGFQPIIVDLLDRQPQAVANFAEDQLVSKAK